MLSDADNRDCVELTVVIPTFNERDNVVSIIERLNGALTGIRWEAIFVDDDSPDGTADLVRQISRCNFQVRCIQRIGRRGLSSACVEGILASSATCFAVIDADMQHDETVLPRMLQNLRSDDLDIVIGSRYAVGGGLGEWDKQRRAISRVATLAAKLVIKADLKDPMSGFFLMRRQAFDGAVRNLSQQGFKILLDLFASSPSPLRFAEVPYQFRQRLHGESKLDSMVAWEYGMLLFDKLFGRLVPPRLVFFAIVGGTGLLIHMFILVLTLRAGFTFPVSQALAVLTAMTTNFALNNQVTYRDRRLTGRRFLYGLFSFYLICSVGAVASVGVATLLYGQDRVWWFAGLAGAIVGVVWNYAASAFITWRRSS